MTRQFTRSPRRNAPSANVVRLAQGEDGSITIFACFMIMIMVMVGAFGVDLMRSEMERTRIQAVSDQAVLAAADLDQTLDPEAVVRDYFAKSGLNDMVSSVVVDEGLNYRTVQVRAGKTVDTPFLAKLGTPALDVRSLSTAEERVANVEISLVLDISGSMRENNKMYHLRNAASAFVDTVLKPENRDLISVSLIPYTAQVNAGSDIFHRLKITEKHRYSWCVDFASSDFNYAGLDLSRWYEHMQHFEAGYSWNGRGNRSSDGVDNIDNPGCPKRSYEEIYPFSQSANLLKSRINQLQPRANTSIHLGMKWGTAMLDPSFNSISQNIGVDAAFTNRPAPYSDMETLKTVVLMTDGENVSTYRISNYYYNDYYQHWSNYPLFWYLNNYVNDRDHYKWRYTKYSAGDADNMLDSICDAAKAKGIVIWSIGFEVSNSGADVMRNCASSPSHFFRVEGVEITKAFQAIARQINQLRLTQ